MTLPSGSQEFRGVCGARGLGECFSGKDILGLPGREVLGERRLQKDPNEAQQDQSRLSLVLAEFRMPWFSFLVSLHLIDEFPSHLTVQLPYVMNELTLTELDMGFSIPKVLHASAPSVDHQGRKIIYKGSGMFMLSDLRHQWFQFPKSPNVISISLTASA